MQHMDMDEMVVDLPTLFLKLGFHGSLHYAMLLTLDIRKTKKF